MAELSRAWLAAGLVAQWACSSTSNEQVSERWELDVAGGRIAGFESNGVVSFKGIPYAAPPVGEGRWTAPSPVIPWDGVRSARELGNDCMQAPSEDEPLQTTPSEDCLFVNVWRPAAAAPSALLPVLVWIHGGGFVGGGSSISVYDGSAFARRGIVVVSMNHRLGRLGFFAHPALLAAAPDAGNFGFMDQIAALDWVQQNIAQFGGDPARVTLMGESAGGASVLALATSPVVPRSFERIVVLSGGGRTGIAIRDRTGGTAERPSADQLDARYADSLGIEATDAGALAALRALPSAEVQGDLTLRNLAAEALIGSGNFQGTQMRDGQIVRDDPGDMLSSEEVPPLPVLIGTTAAEFPIVLPPRDDPFSFFGPEAEAARTAYRVPDGPLPPEASLAVLLTISQDLTMHEPARFVADRMTALGRPAWVYRFTYTAESQRPESLAQTHAGELPFLFDTLPARYGEAVTSRDRETATAFNAAVANFVLAGDPNGPDAPSWPSFDPSRPALLSFTLDEGPVYGADPLEARLDLVQRAVERAGAAAAP